MATATRWADTAETRRAETQILADTERLWRDWKAYVREQQSILAQRMHTTRTMDDLTTPVEGNAVEVVQANISGTRRREFDETVEKRRRDLQAEMEAEARSGSQPFPDADSVLERLLNIIERELDGKVHPKGYALVWRQGMPFEFDASGVTSVSHDDDYLNLKKQQTVKPHIIVLVAVGSLIGLLLLGWVLVRMLFPASASSHSSAPRSEPKLSLVGGEEGNTPFAMLGTNTILLRGREIPGTPAVGYPLFICVPDAAIEALTPGTTVTVSGTDNIRTYTVNAPGDGQPPDFLFGQCTKEETAIAASASLVDIVTMEHLDPSLLISIAAWLPETSPQTIPSNQALVQMILRGRGVRGSLLMGDGSTTRAPTDVSDGDGQTTLSYLVPLEWTEQMAAWRRAEDREGIPRRLIVEIPRAQGRAVWLRDRLHVSNQTATVTEFEDGMVHLDIAFTLTAEEDDPLPLIASDLRLSPPADWEPPMLQPGASEDVSLVLQGSLSSPLDIAIGDWNAQISW
jgi:hypothetical protein